MKVMDSGKLPPSWSALTWSLHTLNQALTLLTGKVGTIYMDLRYTFWMVHTFRKICEERDLLNAKGKSLIHEGLMKEPLENLKLPEEIAVTHIIRHQIGISVTTYGNNSADIEAKRASAEGTEKVLHLKQLAEPLPNSVFSEKEKKDVSEIGGTEDPDGRQLFSKP